MPEEEQYEEICKNRFDNIDATLIKIHNRLFMDNGDECLQSKINRHDNWIKRCGVAIAAVGVSVLGLLVWVIKLFIAHELGGG